MGSPSHLPARPTRLRLYCSTVRSVERRRTRTSTRPLPFHSAAPCPYTFGDDLPKTYLCKPRGSPCAFDCRAPYIHTLAFCSSNCNPNVIAQEDPVALHSHPRVLLFKLLFRQPHKNLIMVLTIRIDHSPQPSLVLKSKRFVQLYRAFVEGINIHSNLLIAQFFKVIAQHQANRFFGITSSPIVAPNRYTVLEGAITALTTISIYAANHAMVFRFDRKAKSVVLPIFQRGLFYPLFASVA